METALTATLTQKLWLETLQLNWETINQRFSWNPQKIWDYKVLVDLIHTCQPCKVTNLESLVKNFKILEIK